MIKFYDDNKLMLLTFQKTLGQTIILQQKSPK